jgi:pre-mRNA-splicing factor ISY1
MLFRFREAQAADLGIVDAARSRRPKMITQVDSIPVCEKWRGQVVKEISRKMSRIQESALSDYQIRDLNDELNKLMREKHMWEVQIRNLGGPNYMRGQARLYDENGREIAGSGGGKGYKYYGRARELPGVKELIEAAEESARAKMSRKDEKLEESKDLRKIVDASYYGYGPDEEDDTLLRYEAEKERQAVENLLENGPQDAPEGWVSLPGDVGDGRGWELPTMDEVQQELMDRRKRKLLEQL